MSFFETHAHLGDPKFDADREETIARARAAGVTRIIEIADSPEEWDQAVALARAHPQIMRCALGLHPYYADRFDENFLQRLKNAIAAPEVVAIGEIGLDYAKSEVPAELQRRAFAACLDAGKDWDIPLAVHCRDAYADLLPMLSERFPLPPKDRRFWGVVHCFSGTTEQALACKILGFALGADGPVTYKKNDALREALRAAGPDAVVLETDSPYLPPQSIRGRRNEPNSLPEIAAKLAEVWGLSIADAASRTTQNAADLFRRPTGPA